MSLISRVTTWVASQILTSSALNGEFNNITNLLNNLDAGTTSWTNVKVGTLISTGTTQLQTANPTQIVSNMSVVGITSLANQGGTSLTIQGFTGGVAGQIIYFFNDTNVNPVTFVYNGSGSQTFSFEHATNLIIGPLGSAIFSYNAQDGVWACLGKSGAAGTQGVLTNSNAAAGYVGEFVSSFIPVGSIVSAAATTTYKDLTSISLTAGDWDISLLAVANLNGATMTEWTAGIGTVTGNSATGLAGGDTALEGAIPTNATDIGGTVPAWRTSIAATTTYYFKIEATFSAGTPRFYGRISARRVR